MSVESEPHTTWLGRGSVQRLPEALAALSARAPEAPTHVFFVTGGSSYARCGARETVDAAVSQYKVTQLESLADDPLIEDVERAVELYRREVGDAPCIALAVGGGRVIDTAKLVAIFAAQSEAASVCVRDSLPLAAATTPLIAMPTTAGTGSEATHFATLYVGEAKHSIAHTSIRPRVAIVDAGLTDSVPPAVTAATGLDALCQAVESLWANRADDASRAFARRAVALIVPRLEAAVHRPTPEIRDALAEAANLAGRAIDVSRTTACHAMSYPLTIRWGVPHGHAVALTLGEMIVHNAAVSAEDVWDPGGLARARAKVEEVIHLLDCSTAQQARARVQAMIADAGLATRLSQLGVADKADRDFIAGQVNLERLRNNPRALTRPQIDAILERLA